MVGIKLFMEASKAQGAQARKRESRSGYTRPARTGHVRVSELAEEQQQIRERLRRRAGRLQEELQLREPRGRVTVHVHQRQIVQSDLIELLLLPRRHVSERFSCEVEVAREHVDARLKVEALDQARLDERCGVADGAQLHAVRRAPNGELRVLLRPPLNHLLQHFARLGELLEAEKAQGHVVAELGRVALDGPGALVEAQCLFEFPLLRI